MEDLDPLIATRAPTAARPLLGLTVLVVEDSRFACEAMRLLCLRSGARIRRADSLASARRHLQVYRPSVVIVDLGLPDGAGEDLIAAMAQADPRVSVVLGISGDDGGKARAMAAGADGFLAKPVDSLALFQQAVLAHLPPERQPTGPRTVNEEIVAPDPLAFQDDIAHAAEVLDGSGAGAGMVDYVAQFLAGVARSARDEDLAVAVQALSERRRQGGAGRRDIARISALLQQRLQRRIAI
jgi:CheY-like chemotaxis protein